MLYEAYKVGLYYVHMFREEDSGLDRLMGVNRHVNIKH